MFFSLLSLCHAGQSAGTARNSDRRRKCHNLGVPVAVPLTDDKVRPLQCPIVAGQAMRPYMTKPCMLQRNKNMIAASAVTFICIFLLTSCVGGSSDSNTGISTRSYQSASDCNSPAEDSNGPTILLGYSKEDMKINPISSFMYFVPLISPTLVDRETSADNEQQTGIISYKTKVTSRSFHLACEFEILGKGFHKNTFDPAGTIEANIGVLKKGESLTNALDYIKLEGEGLGRIEVEGTMTGSTPDVTEVRIHFNARGRRSPVTVGLYDIKPLDGEYKYENRSNEIVARVNSLVFRKTEKTPRMGIKVASIAKKSESAGLFGVLKGALANLLITPPKVAGLGNETMLSFGLALLRQEPAFTFPAATNIKEDRRVAIGPSR